MRLWSEAHQSILLGIAQRKRVMIARILKEIANSKASLID